MLNVVRKKIDPCNIWRSLYQYLWERLIRLGPDEVGIRKMRSIFFEKSEYSADTGTQPAGCGGENNELKRFNIEDLIFL